MPQYLSRTYIFHHPIKVLLPVSIKAHFVQVLCISIDLDGEIVSEIIIYQRQERYINAMKILLESFSKTDKLWSLWNKFTRTDKPKPAEPNAVQGCQHTLVSTTGCITWITPKRAVATTHRWRKQTYVYSWWNKVPSERISKDLPRSQWCIGMTFCFRMYTLGFASQQLLQLICEWMVLCE